MKLCLIVIFLCADTELLVIKTIFAALIADLKANPKRLSYSLLQATKESACFEILKENSLEPVIIDKFSVVKRQRN